VTTPAQVIYATIADLRLVLDGTDAGTGTAAQLSDEQLTLALQAASDRVTVYAGEVYDPAAATFPGIIHDLTLDLAAWWATTYYLKQKEMPPTSPVQLRYTEAKGVLEAIRKGEIALDFSGGTAPVGGTVINRIPAIFTGEDSNTRVVAGQLQADTPPDMVGRRSLLDDWVAYP
jgi:phage gp36-like protein